MLLVVGGAVLSVAPKVLPKVDSAWQTRAEFYQNLQRCNADQRLDFFTSDVTFCDLLAKEVDGPEEVVRALGMHPSLLSLSLPESWPALTLEPLSTSRGRFGRQLTVEWQALLNGKEVPLGRGLTMMKVDPETGKVERIIEVAELPWRFIGNAALALVQLVSFVQGRAAVSDLCQVDNALEAAGKAAAISVMEEGWASAVPRARPGSFVDTVGDGLADAMVIDTVGDGRADRLVSIAKQPGWLSDGVSVKDIGATAGAEAILGFYQGFNDRNLDEIIRHCTEDVVYEDLMLGSVTTYAGQEDFTRALSFHPAFATDQMSGKGPLGTLPSFTLRVVNLVESDDVLGVEWLCEIDGEPLAFGGRGLSQVHICQESFKIRKVTDFCEALWRVVGSISRPLLVPLLQLSSLRNADTSDKALAPADDKPEMEVPTVKPGWAVDTTGDGVVDTRFVDTVGDGLVDTLLPLNLVVGDVIDIDGDGIPDAKVVAGPDGTPIMELLEEASPAFTDIEGKDKGKDEGSEDSKE